jgi:hypothetical protein
MGYKAAYPDEAIEADRAFIARRRVTRPGEEYRTPTERRVSVGTCARSWLCPWAHCSCTGTAGRPPRPRRNWRALLDHVSHSPPPGRPDLTNTSD